MTQSYGQTFGWGVSIVDFARMLRVIVGPAL